MTLPFADAPPHCLDDVAVLGRLVVTHEAGQSGGLGAEVAASITERCFYHLEAAPVRVTGRIV